MPPSFLLQVVESCNGSSFVIVAPVVAWNTFRLSEKSLLVDRRTTITPEAFCASTWFCGRTRLD
jgi:hypothetical protein